MTTWKYYGAAIRLLDETSKYEKAVGVFVLAGERDRELVRARRVRACMAMRGWSNGTSDIDMGLKHPADMECDLKCAQFAKAGVSGGGET